MAGEDVKVTVSISGDVQTSGALTRIGQNASEADKALEKLGGGMQKNFGRMQSIVSLIGGEVENQFNTIAKGAEEMGDKLGAINPRFVGVGLVAGAAAAALGLAAGAMAAQTVAAQKLGDQLSSVADKTGLSAEALQKYRLVAAQADSSVEQIARTINRLNVNLWRSEGDSGKRMRSILESVGIDPASVKDGEEMLKRVADVVMRLAPQDRVSFTRALGINENMIAMLKLGSEEIDRMGSAVANMTPITEAGMKAAGEFQDGLDRVRVAAGGLGRWIWNEIGPWLARAVNTITDTVTALGGFANFIEVFGNKGAGSSLKAGMDLMTKGIEGVMSESVQRVTAMSMQVEELETKLSSSSLNRVDRIRTEEVLRRVRGGLELEQKQLEGWQKILDTKTKRVDIQTRAEKAEGTMEFDGSVVNRERREKKERDPDEQLRRLTERMRLAAMEAANELDTSPEAKSLRDAMLQIGQADEASASAKMAASTAAMEKYLAERNKRMIEVQQKAFESYQQSLAIVFQERDATTDAFNENMKRLRFEMQKLQQDAADSVDPIGGLVRKMDELKRKAAEVKVVFSDEEWGKIKDNLAKGITGIRDENEDLKKQLEDMHRSIEGFGRDMANNIANDLERGENAFASFFDNLKKMAVRRLLYEAIGKPVDAMLKDLVNNFGPAFASKESSYNNAGGMSFFTFLGSLVGSGGSEGGGGSFVGNGATGIDIPRGYAAIVGERGVEMASNAGDGPLRITPLAQTGGGGGDTFYINVAAGADQTLVDYKIRRAIEQARQGTREEMYTGGAMARLAGRS